MQMAHSNEAALCTFCTFCTFCMQMAHSNEADLSVLDAILSEVGYCLVLNAYTPSRYLLLKAAPSNMPLLSASRK
jgi:hypothetical protein